DVRPPREFLSLGWWIRDEASPSAAPGSSDYDTVMRLRGNRIGAEALMRTTRRHLPWTYLDEMAGDGRRRLEITNVSSQLRMSFSRDASGVEQRLMITKGPVNSVYAHDMNEHGKIIGEDCNWFRAAQSAHGFDSECRTHDGITLMEDHY